jgi:hypothetical protein
VLFPSSHYNYKLQFFDFRCWRLSSCSPECVGITYAAYSSILHQIVCHKLMVASRSISEEKYPQKNQGTAGPVFRKLLKYIAHIFGLLHLSRWTLCFNKKTGFASFCINYNKKTGFASFWACFHKLLWSPWATADLFHTIMDSINSCRTRTAKSPWEEG